MLQPLGNPRGSHYLRSSASRTGGFAAGFESHPRRLVCGVRGELRRYIAAVSTLFGQPWWLEAVSPGAWGEARVERDGVVVARLPWATRRLPVPGIKLTRLGSPKLTPFLVPSCNCSSGKPVTQLATEHKLLDGLWIAHLPLASIT